MRIVFVPRLFVGAALISIPLLGGACGGGEQSGSAPAGEPAATPAGTAELDACALVTRADAEKALGAAVGDAERPKEAHRPPVMMACRYTAPRGQGLAVLSLIVRQGYSDFEAKSVFQSTREEFSGTQSVQGLGDDAFWLADQLYVLEGRTQVTLSGDIDREMAMALARTALSRLP